jgi:hypothetical protein
VHPGGGREREPEYVLELGESKPERGHRLRAQERGGRLVLEVRHPRRRLELEVGGDLDRGLEGDLDRGRLESGGLGGGLARGAGAGRWRAPDLDHGRHEASVRRRMSASAQFSGWAATRSAFMARRLVRRISERLPVLPRFSPRASASVHGRLAVVLLSSVVSSVRLPIESTSLSRCPAAPGAGRAGRPVVPPAAGHDVLDGQVARAVAVLGLAGALMVLDRLQQHADALLLDLFVERGVRQRPGEQLVRRPQPARPVVAGQHPFRDRPAVAGSARSKARNRSTTTRRVSFCAMRHSARRTAQLSTAVSTASRCSAGRPCSCQRSRRSNRVFIVPRSSVCTTR